jgi:hypothetical protein
MSINSKSTLNHQMNRSRKYSQPAIIPIADRMSNAIDSSYGRRPSTITIVANTDYEDLDSRHSIKSNTNSPKKMLRHSKSVDMTTARSKLKTNSENLLGNDKSKYH